MYTIVFIIITIFLLAGAYELCKTLCYNYRENQKNHKRQKEILQKISNGIYEHKVKIWDDVYMVNTGGYDDKPEYYTGKTGFVNSNDKYLIPLKYETAVKVANANYCLVKFNQLYGVVDYTGKEVIPCNCVEIESDNRDYSIAVQIDSNGKYKCALLNSNGHLYTDFIYDAIDDKGENFTSMISTDDRLWFYFGEMLIAKKGTNVGVLNLDGTIHIPFNYSKMYILAYQHVLAMTHKSDGTQRYTLFDDNGKPLIDSDQNIIRINNTMVKIRQNDGLFTLHDYKGCMICSTHYNDYITYDESKCIIEVWKGNKCGLYKTFISKNHYNMDDYEELLYHNDCEWIEIIPPKYDSIEKNKGHDEICAVRKENKFGIFDYCGNLIVDFDFERCESAYEIGDKLRRDYHRNLYKYTQKIPIKGNESNLSTKSKDTSFYILFIDTETTGIPIDNNAPISDNNNWPHMVQICWLLKDVHNNTISKKVYIIKPENYVIPKRMTDIHGISHEYATNNGCSLQEVLDDFIVTFRKAKFVVGHNVDFDIKIIAAELYRKNFQYSDLLNCRRICTMKSSVEYCKISNERNPAKGYKWPKLQELHNRLFNYNYTVEHNAENDVEATAKCFFELVRLKVISIHI